MHNTLEKRIMHKVFKRSVAFPALLLLGLSVANNLLAQGLSSLEISDLVNEYRIPREKMILQALNNCGNNKTEAAKILGITRRRLYSRMKFHGIDPS